MLGRFLNRWSDHRRPRKSEADELVAEATALFASGETEMARTKVFDALEIESDYVPALQLQGAVLSTLGQYAAALESFGRAVCKAPKNPSLRFDYGNALRLAGELEDAEVEYRQALDLAPDVGHIHRSLGNLLLEMKRPAEALAAYQRALEIVPDDDDARRRMGAAAFRTRNFKLVKDSLAPLYTRGQLNSDECYFLGTALLFLGEIKAAGDVLEAILAVLPEELSVNCMLGFKHLFAGNWTEGFRLLERRLDSMRTNPEMPGMKTWLEYVDSATAGIPPWKGEICSGKHLLVWAEQGLGDTLMMMRLLPVLREQWHAAEVTLLCQAPLAALEGAVGGGIRFIALEDGWKAPPGEFDNHCALMSLPYLMGITQDAIPGQVPYLRVPDDLRLLWSGKAGTLAGLKVGLAWAGNPKLTLDMLRSVALSQLAPLLACPGVSFVSLQKDEAAREELRVSGVSVVDWMDQCDDFLQTAALVENLDLVISVDSAVAHLAGAMGKPVWLLNRAESEWRWLRDREDSLWYPSMRIFNQTESRNWGPVIIRMAEELKALAGSRLA